MRAAIRQGFLGYKLCYTTTHPDPVLVENNNVKIRVHHAAINPVDYKAPRAMLGPIYGLDVSGTVMETNNESEFKIGDKVFGRTFSGSLADFTITHEKELCLIPEGWTDEDCAALPTVYLTALQGLRSGGIVLPTTMTESEGADDENDSQQKNEKRSLVVIGASGGCGLAAVQLAKAMKVDRIIAICSGRNTELVKKNGATEVVDYTDSETLTSFWKREAGMINCVYDAVTFSGKGEDYTASSMELLRPGSGQYVTLNGPASLWLRKAIGMERKNQQLIVTQCSREDLQSIVTLLDSISTRPIITLQSFTEQGVRDGFEMLKSRRTRGKIVFNVLKHE